LDLNHLHLEHDQPYFSIPDETRQCREQQVLGGVHFAFSCGFGKFVSEWPSELFITVNYTLHWQGPPIRPIKVRLVYTDDISAVLEYTKPVFLIPGINFMGVGSGYILQRSKNNVLASLGMFEVGHMSVQLHS